MNERRKLAEAERFYDHLKNVKFDAAGGFDRDAFEDYLSAFLSAARSALQYALKEASTHTGGQQWYQDAFQKYAVVRFLKDERDWSIHENPVAPNLHVTVKFPGGIVATADGGLRHVDDDGNVLQEVRPLPGGGPVTLVAKPDIIPRYYFDGWAGPEDVVTLCQQYLDELAVIVADGQSREFLTPDAAGDGRKASRPDNVSMQVRARREAPDHEGPDR